MIFPVGDSPNPPGFRAWVTWLLILVNVGVHLLITLPRSVLRPDAADPRLDAYLRASWHPQTRPSSLAFDPAQRWLGLKIVACKAGGTGDATGQVEFVARYKIHGKAFRLHENSRFCRVDGHWVYVDGDIDPSGLP